MTDVDREARPLTMLLRAVPDARVPAATDGIRVTGVSTDAGRVEPGQLFVAVPGVETDGHAFVEEAVRRGAAAVLTERPVDAGEAPVVRVGSTRRALAHVAAAWFGRPGDRLRLVGITGSLGKTSILMMLESIFADDRLGILGSLGARLGERRERTRLTTPDAWELHRILAWMAEAGAERVAMEVTSHALEQERAHGLAYELGVFTNLVPLEHAEYHGSFRRYVDAKVAFFDHLDPDAPVVYGAGNPAVSAVVRSTVVRGVGCGAGSHADVRVRPRSRGADGTRIAVETRRPLPAVGGGSIGPVRFEVDTTLLGRSNVTNAGIAAAAALCLGAPVERVRRGLRAFRSPRRRMEIVHHGRFTALDDTVGHPDSITAVFEVASRLDHRRLHAVYAVRGGRGAEINRRDAEAVAIWARRLGIAGLVVTAAAEATDEANRVEPPERRAFIEPLQRTGIEHRYRERLDDAIGVALAGVGRGDLLLLLGAQGMNTGAETLRRRLPTAEGSTD